MGMMAGYKSSCFVILFGVMLIMSACGNKDHRGKEYMVQVEEEWIELIKKESERFGLKFKNKVVSNIYLFEAVKDIQPSEMLADFAESFQGKVLTIEPRSYAKLSYLIDSPAPLGFKQWIRTRGETAKGRRSWPYFGMDIQEAWSMGCTGEDIVVAVVDTGVELDHADLIRNINLEMSRSFVMGDPGDGSPGRLPFYNEFDVFLSHGTLAAGLIASEFGNGICSAGVAFNATLVSLKVFSLNEGILWQPEITFPEDYVSQALGYKRDTIDIYSCSFSLDSMFSSSTNVIRTVLKEGVEQGRNGKGSIFVFSAGNKGAIVYDCNTVFYTNSIYTITISSVGKEGTKPRYAVPCSCILAAAYGEYKTYNGTKKLETTTFNSKCDSFNGTSASAALASGIIAQILQAKSELTWRDVQYIIVMSSSLDRITFTWNTVTNSAGFKYNPYFGFGLMNATAAVLQALNWTNVPKQVNQTIFATVARKSLTKTSLSTAKFKFPFCDFELDCLRFIEHVRVGMAYQIQSGCEKQLEITLCSPAKTCSTLLRKKLDRPPENTHTIQRHWNFTTVQFWGESPYGYWTLLMKIHKWRKGNASCVPNFQFVSAAVTIFGTATNPFPETVVLNEASWIEYVIDLYVNERDEILMEILYNMYYTPYLILYSVILLSGLLILLLR